MKTNFKKIAVAGLLAASVTAACKKEPSTNQNQESLSYKVRDMVQVNNEEGKPRPLKTLPQINDEPLALSDQALSGGQVTFKNTNGPDQLLKVVDNTDGKLTLAQNYPAADGLASGTVYYVLSRN